MDWPKLPRNDKKKLAKCCFVYDEATDTYCCPMGKTMPYRETKKYDGSQGKKAVRIYACKDCSGCPLAAECLDAKANVCAHGDSGWVRALARENVRQAAN